MSAFPSSPTARPIAFYNWLVILALAFIAWYAADGLMP
jgi:hypothetical protein